MCVCVEVVVDTTRIGCTVPLKEAEAGHIFRLKIGKFLLWRTYLL